MRPFHRVESRASSHAPTITEQFARVEGLKDSADRGFRRYSTPRTQQPRPGQEIAANISGPLGDRDQAARTGTHRRFSDGKNPGQVVAATTTTPRGSAMVANTPSSHWPQTSMVRDDEHTRGAS